MERQMSDVARSRIEKARLGRRAVVGGAVSAAALAGLPAGRAASAATAMHEKRGSERLMSSGGLSKERLARMREALSA